jgi:hypothetical protein
MHHHRNPAWQKTSVSPRRCGLSDAAIGSRRTSFFSMVFPSMSAVLCEGGGRDSDSGAPALCGPGSDGLGHSPDSDRLGQTRTLKKASPTRDARPPIARGAGPGRAKVDRWRIPPLVLSRWRRWCRGGAFACVCACVRACACACVHKIRARAAEVRFAPAPLRTPYHTPPHTHIHRHRRATAMGRARGGGGWGGGWGGAAISRSCSACGGRS